MECNKEEAIRAKEIAEKRMTAGDFLGAQKIARKAQQLFPALDNVTQLLTVCEVHCSAQNKILGTEMDWYSILQIERSVDEVTIKKQYRKLALLLHPDKNKFPGAEAAFKLIGEANRVLSDKAKRSVYDLKFRVPVKNFAPKSQDQPSQRNAFRKQQAAASNIHNGPHSQYGAANNVPKPPYMQFAGVHPSQNVDKTTFWTCCGNCNIRYQYLRTHVNKVLRCQNCQQSFTAYDLGSQGVPPGHPWSHLPNQNGIPNPPFQNGFPNPGPSKIPSQSNPSRVASQSNRGKPSAMTQEKVHVRKNVKESVRMQKPNVANGKEGVGKAKQDGGKPSECGTSRSSEKKRKRKPDSESSASYETSNDDEDEDVDLAAAQNIRLNTGHPTRKSSRQKQNVSYNENKNDDDDFVSPAKRSKPSNVSKEEVNEASAGKDKDDAIEPETLHYPDPEFSDFDEQRAENCFAVNQVWAIYDTCDGMPRFYARIKKVFSPFKLQITWLEAEPEDKSENQWCDVELPVACGKFINGSTEGTEDRLMFSHQITVTKGAARNSCWVYPRKGETWALFKDWDIKWSSDPEKHKPPYDYEFVEVVADFSKEDGIGVAYLGKVKGFVSVFQRIAKNGFVSFHVAPRELYRFSHQIPSSRLTGKEREGVPEGSSELDPASLPSNLDELDAAPSSFFSCSSTSNAKSPMDCKKSSIPRNRESDLKRENSERKNQNRVEGGNEDKTEFMASQPKRNTTFPADERTRTPTKHQESDVEMDALQRRKSPRDLSKKSNSINASQHTTQEDANKHLDAKKKGKHNSVPLTKESASSSVSDGNMHLPVRNGSSTCAMETSNAPTPPTTSHKVSDGEFHDFKEDKSEGKFEIDQIWALYSDGDGMPRSYAQVKVIESTPDFRLHVALLEACLPPKDPSRPICCGTFKLKNGKTKILQRSAFSHEVKAKPAGRNRFELYPRKGEVWALYKNLNSESTESDHDKGECDIVEVLEDNDQCIKVAVLMRVNGIKALYRVPRSQRSKTGFLEIAKADVTRFSHQIPACLLTGEKDSLSKGCWYADPLAIPCSVICLE